MKNHTLTFHKEQPVCGKRILLNVFRILAILAILLAILVGLGGCAHPGTAEQQEAARIQRGKNIARLERRAWNLGGFLANLAGTVIINTATNYATERLSGDRGFRK